MKYELQFTEMFGERSSTNASTQYSPILMLT